MTAPELLGLISAALLLQLAVGIGVAWMRRERAASPMAAPSAAAVAARGARAAWAGWREFKVVRRELEDAAGTQCSFYLRPVDDRPLPSFLPGQFLTFGLDVGAAEPTPGKPPGRVTRCYSLSDEPGADHYRITVKRVPAPADHPEWPPGLASHHLHDQVRVGDILHVRAPSGHFFLDPDPTLPVVLVAGGIGITPMFSMLRWCITHQPARPVHLFYGVRNGGEHAFKRELDQLAAIHPALHLHVAYSRPAATDAPGADYQHQGHVDIDLLRRTLPHGAHHFYLCGPAAMMQTLVPALAAWGVPPEAIHFEAFGPATLRPPAAQAARASATHEVRFRRSGRTVTWDGRDSYLLDFGERHGIDLDSGCRSGGCGACETRLLDGSVHYEHVPDHDPAPGHCLLCVARPTSAITLEA